MSFSLDLKKFSDAVDARANKTVRNIVFGVDRSLVEKSPVGNPELWKNPTPPGYVGGRFRANWQYGEGSQPEGELYTPIVGPFPSASEAIELAMGGVSQQAAGKVHYLVNNLPYAQRLEDGWSTQAPAGVVGLTVIDFEPIVKTAVSEAGADAIAGVY